VLGLYLLFTLGGISFFREAGFLFAFPAAVLGALLPSLPIMIQASRAAFAGVDRELEEAALTLGRRPWEVFLRVTLPLARRTLLVGLALSSARALGDFGVTLMVAGNIPGRTQTLPLYIYGQVESLNFARAHLAALLLVGVGIASLCLVRRLEAGAHERLA
jgi:molybdate transport system permease protein